MTPVLDLFIPRPDIRERHETVVRAPAGLVFDVARGFDMESIPLVRAIFWLRGRVLRARRIPPARPGGLDADALRAMGWGVLEEIPGRLFVAGAACQPWLADVVFTPIPSDRFADYAEPDRVKIAWTMEAEPLEPALSRLATETRAVATDARLARLDQAFESSIVASCSRQIAPLSPDQVVERRARVLAATLRSG